MTGCGTSSGGGAGRASDCGDTPAAATHLPGPEGTASGDIAGKPIPAYGRYNFSVTDYLAVDCGTLKAAADGSTARTGISVRILNRLEDLTEENGAMQVVNNVRVDQLEQLIDPATSPPPGTSLFTLYLPPGWKKTESLPILLVGLGYTQSNNGMLMQPFFADMVALSRKEGKRGLIAATSNTGGMEGLGVHDSALDDVGRFLGAMGGMGGNPQEVVMSGTSRGGIVSFVWAANRLNYPYRAVAIFASVPTPRVGPMFDLSLSLQTYPAVLGVFTTTLGPEGWKQSDDPATKADMIEIFSGHRIGREADQDRLPFGYLTDPAYRERWQGLQAVVIGGGFHDEWIPFFLTLELDRLLSATLSRPHLSLLALGSGHLGASFSLYQELARFLDHFLQPSPPPYVLPRQGRVYLLQNDLLSHDPNKETVLNTTVLPFTASFPYTLGVGQPGSLITCGPVGKGWKATLQNGAGGVVFAGGGAFDSEECAHTPFTLSAEGDFFWTFEFDGKIQNPTNTSCLHPDTAAPLPAFTRTVAHKPTPAESFIPKCGIGFGLDQFHGPNGIRP